MAVTSTTLSGVNVFQFSGVVTDAEIGTAFAGTISEGRYVLNRAIYLDQTADLTNVTGGFLIDFGTQVLPAIILDTRRDRTKSVFKNFVFYQRTGLSVPNRNSFVRTWNGTGFANAGSGLSIDGVAQNGGGFFYAVQGVNPAGGDNRWLNEMAFAGPMANNTVASQQFALEELQVCMGASTTIKGMTFEKAYGFPQLSPALANANVTVYRSNMNTESLVNGGLIPIRLFPSFNRWSSVCYVDSYVTRLGADITTRLVDAFGSNATSRAHFTVLNNYTRESWFGASKANIAITTWGAANTIHGGVLKKLQFINGSGGVVKSYDSRSTTTSQPCKFSETGFFDFLDPNIAPTVDSEGKIELVHMGAIASGVTAAIARYAEQKYTFQKFGYRVIVATPDMTSGDNDLSAFTPISLTIQNALTRTQGQIQSATTISNFKELLEELHVLAIISTGSDSYTAPFGGNYFALDGRSINTEFDSIVIDPNATSKIAYNGVTNTLTIKSSLISSTTDVNEWRNEGGTFTFLNGAQINGVFADNDGSRVNVFNLDPENFGITWFLRYKKTSDTAWTELSGTGNSTTILADLDEYDMMLRVPGYQWREIVFDTNESLSIDANLSYHVSANNTPQYTMSFDANLESKINFDPVANSVSVENETGVITQPGFAELYQATERIQHLPALVWTFNAPITANSTSQKILIPDGNPITFFLTEGSNASVKVTCPVIHADTGESADDRVRGNSDGFSIILGSPATAESAGLQSAIVSDILAKIGGVGYSIENDNLQKINEKVQSLENTDLTGIATTDNVNDVLDAVNNIEPTDISALALEASVQQSLTAIDLTLKDADYVEPDNTTIGQIKSKVDTLENYDDTETQTKLDTLQTTVDNIDVDFTPVLDAIDLTLKETDYTAPDNATIAEIQTKVDTLENTDITPVLDAVQDNFEVTKIISVEVQKLN